VTDADKASGPPTAAVCTDLPVMKLVPGHHHTVPFFLTKDMFGGLPFEIAGGEITHLVGKPVADPHRHDVAEIYLLVTPAGGRASIDVDIEGERHTLEAPAAIMIPAGATHAFVTRAASHGSYCFGILLQPGPSR